MVKKALVVALATALSLCASAGEGIVLEIDPQARYRAQEEGHRRSAAVR